MYEMIVKLVFVILHYYYFGIEMKLFPKCY